MRGSVNVLGAPLGTDAFVEAFVRDSAAAMLKLLDNPDENQGSEESFERLPEGSKRCLSCRFRSDCGR